MFGKSVPEFNLKGISVIKSRLGAACTMILISLILVYASTKFIQLDAKHNPNISSHIQVQNYSPEDPMNMNEIDFRFAVSFEGYLDRELKVDKKYVKWYFRLYGARNNVEFEEILPYHRCKEEDFEKFYPIWDDQKQVLDRVRDSDGKNGFLCIDWDDDKPYYAYGKDKDANFQRVEIILTPCNYLHKEVYDYGEVLPDECETDREKQFEYMSASISLIMLYNNGRFDPTKYGDDKIVKESLITQL